MLAHRDLMSEVKELEAQVLAARKQGEHTQAAILKAQLLAVKLQRDIKTNIVTIMKHLGIELLQSNRRDGDAETDES